MNARFYLTTRLFSGLFAVVSWGWALSADLPVSTPEKQGVSSVDLLRFVEALDSQIDGVHSVMVVRNGHVIAEGWWHPYRKDLNHVLYSLSKSFTSTAVGMAIAEGRFQLDDPVLKFFPDDAPANPTDQLKAMRVRDLLTMSAGHESETASAADKISAKAFLAHPVPRQPGTFFKYNTPATFMLSAIVQKTARVSVLEYLKPRLFEPLGIQGPVWDASWEGISLGGYGLRVRTGDIAAFGQLYLQEGKWQGRELVPDHWVRLAVARQIANGDNPDSDWNQGYGFQFWRCRNGAYRGDGAFGQYCIVMPEQNAVVAVTSGLGNMQDPLNLIWNKLLPIFQNVELTADPRGVARLRDKLFNLEIDPPSGLIKHPHPSLVKNRTYHFPDHASGIESVSLSQSVEDANPILKLAFRGQDRLWEVGSGLWREAVGPIGPFSKEPLMARAAWESDSVCVLKMVGVETPYILEGRLVFNGGEAVLSARLNVAFGPKEMPPITGQSSE